jgi:hypothetical protein
MAKIIFEIIALLIFIKVCSVLYLVCKYLLIRNILRDYKNGYCKLIKFKQEV